VAGDCRQLGRWIAQAAIDERADFILFTGGLVFRNASTLSEFEAQLTICRDPMQPLYDGNTDVYPVRGNHALTRHRS
jgi:hypothetical protein